MTNYSELQDKQLLDLVSQRDIKAENELVSRYSRLVRVCARPFFLAGGDSEDLLQEGMLGLLSAVREFDPSGEASFRTFAELCIRRRLISAIKSAQRLKHSPLNDGVSLDEILSLEHNSGHIISDEAFSRSPEEQVLDRERRHDLISFYSRFLSNLENEILKHYLEGLSYLEISEITGRSPKSVDNAVQRIRHKLARHLKSGDNS